MATTSETKQAAGAPVKINPADYLALVDSENWLAVAMLVDPDKASQLPLPQSVGMAKKAFLATVKSLFTQCYLGSNRVPLYGNPAVIMFSPYGNIDSQEVATKHFVPDQLVTPDDMPALINIWLILNGIPLEFFGTVATSPFHTLFVPRWATALVTPMLTSPMRPELVMPTGSDVAPALRNSLVALILHLLDAVVVVGRQIYLPRDSTERAAVDRPSEAKSLVRLDDHQVALLQELLTMANQIIDDDNLGYAEPYYGDITGTDWISLKHESARFVSQVAEARQLKLLALEILVMPNKVLPKYRQILIEGINMRKLQDIDLTVADMSAASKHDLEAVASSWSSPEARATFQRLYLAATTDKRFRPA